MKKQVLSALVCSSLLGGCLSFRGPEPVYGTRGVVGSDHYGPRNGHLFERFRNAAAIAAGCEARPEGPAQDNRGDPALQCEMGVDGAVEPADIRAFQLAGYALIYADCSNYFAIMGRAQTRSRILRDTIAPIAALLTGLLTLKDFGANSSSERDMAGLISLTTGAAASGLDIFDQNFLFGSNNIDSVRQLIVRTLSAHAAATTSATQPATFEDAVINILDHQAICRPSAIMMYTRAAIAEGRVEARRFDQDAVRPLGDTVPDTFSFADQSGAELSGRIESNTLRLSGTGGQAPISIEGGEYQIDGGAWTSDPGYIRPGSTFRVRVTSSGQPSTEARAILSIGGVTDTFAVTTRPPADGETPSPQPQAPQEPQDAVPPPAQSNVPTVQPPQQSTTMSVPPG